MTSVLRRVIRSRLEHGMVDSHACPLCPFRGDQPYAVRLHFEEAHRTNSPFVARDVAAPRPSPSSTRDRQLPSPPGERMSDEDDNDPWAACPRPDCGERVRLSEFYEHLNLHVILDLSKTQDAPRQQRRSQPISRAPSSSSSGSAASSGSYLYGESSGADDVASPRTTDTRRSSVGNVLQYFSDRSNTRATTPVRPRERAPGVRHETQRLGKEELGPHAFEDRMPDEVRQALLDGARPAEVRRTLPDGRVLIGYGVPNETAGVVRVIADLSALDNSSAAAYLCHPATKQIHKISCAGNFCGYWNIQMLQTFLRHLDPHAPRTTPSVLEIQDVIERAWDSGICPYGRIELGTVRNTRKWIGASEAFAYFKYMGYGVHQQLFNDTREVPAAKQLFDYVEAYFLGAADEAAGAERHDTAFVTRRAPIYFQYQGHSLTIVGLERKRNGKRNLLVFDPSHRPTYEIYRLAAGYPRVSGTLKKMLRAYRRSETHMRMMHEFEIIVSAKSLKYLEVRC